MFKSVSLTIAIIVSVTAAYNTLPPTPENTLQPAYCD